MNDDLTKAGISNTGPCVGLVAPGENVFTTFDKNNPILQARQYAYVNGTSFAAPAACGAAALIKAQHNDLNASQIAGRLQNNATALGEPGRDEEYGYGLLNARCSVTPSKNRCWSHRGWGPRVVADRARAPLSDRSRRRRRGVCRASAG